MNRKLMIAAALVACAASAQTKPDFNGTWKLNIAKSDFGVLPPPEERTDVVAQTDAEVKDTVASKGPEGDMAATFSYKTDGSQSVNSFRGSDVKNTCKWDASAFVVDSKLVYQDQDVTLGTRWTLDAEGKTLTMATHIVSPMGETDQTLLFDKLTPGAPAPPAPAAVAAVAHPNFTGNWKLDVAKSDFGMLPPPQARVDKIVHNDPVLKDSYQSDGPEGKSAGDFNYTTDGKENLNRFQGNDLKGVANWDGPLLVIDNKLNLQGNDIAIKSKWDLSPDGKLLTVSAHIDSPMGEMDQKLVFEKQVD